MVNNDRYGKKQLFCGECNLLLTEEHQSLEICSTVLSFILCKKAVFHLKE